MHTFQTWISDPQQTLAELHLINQGSPEWKEHATEVRFAHLILTFSLTVSLTFWSRFGQCLLTLLLSSGAEEDRCAMERGSERRRREKTEPRGAVRDETGGR
jgi:hypothetical protein